EAQILQPPRARRFSLAGLADRQAHDQQRHDADDARQYREERKQRDVGNVSYPPRHAHSPPRFHQRFQIPSAGTSTWPLLGAAATAAGAPARTLNSAFSSRSTPRSICSTQGRALSRVSAVLLSEAAAAWRPSRTSTWAAWACCRRSASVCVKA